MSIQTFNQYSVLDLFLVTFCSGQPFTSVHSRSKTAQLWCAAVFTVTFHRLKWLYKVPETGKWVHLWTVGRLAAGVCLSGFLEENVSTAWDRMGCNMIVLMCQALSSVLLLKGLFFKYPGFCTYTRSHKTATWMFINSKQPGQHNTGSCWSTHQGALLSFCITIWMC